MKTNVAVAAGFAALITAALPGAVHAQQQAAAPLVLANSTLLTVEAVGEVRQKPDIAIVSAGVVTQAATASGALAENRQRMARVIDALRAAGIARADIQTSNLSLSPDYRYDEGRDPQITGYRANNQVSVTIRDIENAGEVLDALVEVGANQFNGPTLQVEDADAALDQARKDAVAKARARAELYASAAGLSVARIASISETAQRNYPPPIVMTAARSDMAEASSKIEPGELAMQSNVTVVFELR